MRQTLVFDADDTLWDEHNLLQRFEADVEALLDRLTGEPSNFRQHFLATESENIPALGYGFSTYIYSLGETLAANPLWRRHKPTVLAEVAVLIAGVEAAVPRLVEGVRPTLEALSADRFRLVLLSRGIDYEQWLRLDRSGVTSLFRDVQIIGRKDVATYREAARALGDPEGAALCMIGNSMHSDVAPALRAGWRAIHVPPPVTRTDDEAEPTTSSRFRRARQFTEIGELVRCADFWD